MQFSLGVSERLLFKARVRVAGSKRQYSKAYLLLRNHVRRRSHALYRTTALKNSERLRENVYARVLFQ